MQDNTGNMNQQDPRRKLVHASGAISYISGKEKKTHNQADWNIGLTTHFLLYRVAC